MPGLLKTRMCDFHKTGTCMAGDLCRFAHEVAELSDAATAWVSTSARDPCDLDEEELGTVASQDVALQILKELEVRVRAAQISQLEESVLDLAPHSQVRAVCQVGTVIHGDSGSRCFPRNML